MWKRKYFLDLLYENENIFWIGNCADQNDFQNSKNFLPKIPPPVDARFLLKSFANGIGDPAFKPRLLGSLLVAASHFLFPNTHSANFCFALREHTFLLFYPKLKSRTGVLPFLPLHRREAKEHLFADQTQKKPLHRYEALF